MAGRSGGDANDGFAFAWATDPNGPYKPAFTVRQAGRQPRSEEGYRGKPYCRELPSDLKGTLYLKVTGTSHAGGQAEAGTLYVDAIYVMHEIPRGPFGMGDGGIGGSPRAVATGFALYGASHVGYLGGLVTTTDVKGIVRVDLLKTDWHHAKAYPTYLYYNPHPEARTVHLDVGKATRDGPKLLVDGVVVDYEVRHGGGE